MVKSDETESIKDPAQIARSLHALASVKDEEISSNSSLDDASSQYSTHQDAEKATVEPEKEADTKRERSKGEIALIMSALCMAVFLAAIDMTVITTAVPTISAYFGSAAGYTWIGSAYLLGAASSTPIWGKISDIFGRKPVLLVANVVFFVGSLVAGLANSIGMLIVARAVQGIGGGGLIVLVNICIGDLFSERKRSVYYGIIGCVWAVASSLGPIVGGLFTEDVSWRWCFYVNLPLDGVAFIILFFYLDIKTPKTPFLAGIKAIDWLGCFFVVTGTLLILFGVQYGGETFPWNSATVICLIVFGVFTLGIFGVVEWKFAKYPIMPARIFHSRSTIACFFVCFIHGFVFVSGSYYMSLYFQAVLGATPILSGVYILAQSVALSLASLVAGGLILKSGQYLLPIIISFVIMVTGFGLFIDLDASSPMVKIIIYQIIAGIGSGPNFQAPLLALQNHVPQRDISTATSTFAFTRNLGTSTSVVIGQVVIQNEMAKRAGTLVKALGPEIAQKLGGGNAGASIKLIQSLPADQRLVATSVLASSLSTMWIVYTAIGAVGLLMAFLIKGNILKKDHKETETGLEAEERNRIEAEREKEEIRAKRGAEKTESAVKA